MTDAADSIVRDQVFLALTPFFLEAAGGDPTQAREAAERMVDGYYPTSTEALLLIAQIVVYTLASLDSARCSASHPELPVSTHLRLRSNAGVMQRAAMQCRKTLDRHRKAQASPHNPAAPHVPAPILNEADLHEAVKRAAAIIQEARAVTQPAKTMTYWEARRETERQKRLAKRAAKTEAGHGGAPAAAA
ncbi:MAG: hypothetical protein U1E70_04385 [Acetobacteraceae bacterium]